MEETKELITTDDIRSKVYILRGQQVMLDQDLAEIYGYQVKNLNQQVKRNLTRFPEDFMFQLTKEEVELVKSQFVTSRNINYFEGQEGGRRKLPYAFTEQGIYMLATVLRGELAEQQSIFIMRTFNGFSTFAPLCMALRTVHHSTYCATEQDFKANGRIGFFRSMWYRTRR